MAPRLLLNSLPFAYNRDLQEDEPVRRDAVDAAAFPPQLATA
jgi:hypothetical protein